MEIRYEKGGWLKQVGCLWYFLFFSSLVYGSYFKHLGMSDGLSHLSVRSLYQDRLGRIWIGTQEGVSVFDGRNVFGYKSIWEGRVNHISRTEQNLLLGNLVSCITGDKLGNIFLLVDDNLVKYDLRQEKFSLFGKGGFRFVDSYRGDIWAIRHDSIFQCGTSDGFSFSLDTDLKGCRQLLIDGDFFWIGTSRGLYKMNKRGKKEVVLQNVDIRALFKDRDGGIWVATLEDGCFLITSQNIERINLCLPSGGPNRDIRCFTQDKQGFIWVGTFEGVYKIDPVSRDLTFYTSDGTENGLKHSSVYSLLTDRDGTVWIGSYYGGVDFLTEKARGIKKYSYSPYRADCLGFPFVGDMIEDKRGNLWICLDGGGLTCLNRKKGTFVRYVASAHGLPHNNLKTICYDKKRDLLYIGTHKGGLAYLDIQSGKFYDYEEHKKKGGTRFPGRIIDKVQMWNDSLVVSARNGLFILHGQTGEGRRLSNGIFPYFDIDNQGILWGINSKTLVRIDLSMQSKIQRISLKEIKASSLSYVLSVGDKVYVATLGAGIIVYDKGKKDLSCLDKVGNNILSNYCYNMCQTRRGNIVFSTDKGIFLYNPLTDKFYNIEMSALFSSNSIVSGCGIYTCCDNELFVGGTNGMISFMENEFFKPSIDLSLYFTQLFVNNEIMTPGDGNQILNESLPLVENLRLPYSKNNLLVTFATSDVGGNNCDVLYEYFLQGFDKIWTVTKKMEVRYTNLPPGNYCLKVRAKGLLKDKMDVLYEASLPIEIANVWYATWWARLFFMVLLLGGGFWIYRVQEVKRRFALSLEKEQLEKAHIEEMNQAKLRFFTNISHEFKTPLALISTQMEIIQQNSQVTTSVRLQLSKVSKYVRQLNELITELLDFRRIEQRKKKLRLSKQNLSFFLKEMFDVFSEHAKRHHVDYRFTDNLSDCNEMWFDTRQMQKVLLNLLSNAFKFTPDGGTIILRVDNIMGGVRICVEDTGIGISNEDLPYVFNRFYQSEANIASTVDKRADGTGIGLALAKSIVEQHHGDINVVSEIGKGTCFTVELPADKSVYEGDKDVVWNETIILPERLEWSSDDITIEDTSWLLPESSGDVKKILVVEDNVELRQILYKLFTPLYEVVLASNGLEGLEKVREEVPDLVLSDVMMPEMSGIEMCRQIKSNLELCHIPVILLTALDSPESNIEGLRMGADDYVTKPFDVRLLLMRCNNMIRNRQLVKEKYTKQMDAEVVMLATNALDKKFLEDIVRVIDANLDNVDFDIPFLCQEVGMSRTAFQRKFKALTNLTPNDFIIQHKLKKAADLLVHDPIMQIGEIADKLGFSTAKYFSRLFKEQFGISPLEYRKTSLLGVGTE